jgi:DNA mismatch endonuclease (patch repair protein)
MSAVKRRDTEPEVVLRRALTELGIRYHLHDQSLPGTPDVVLSDRRVAVFVHGCFWHRHPRCSLATSPKSNVAFWKDKFQRNVKRDARNARILRSAGWSVCTVWQCRIEKDAGREARRVAGASKERLPNNLRAGGKSRKDTRAG